MVITLFLGLAGYLSAQAPDGGDDIRGPKPMVEIAVPEKPPITLWLGLSGCVMLLLVAWFIWMSYKGKRKPKSPPEVALAVLNELEAKSESLGAEAFAYHAAKAVRQYIAVQFGFDAPRRTTEEFLRELARDEKRLLVSEGDHLRTFLKTCDLAKFAGSDLDSNQRGELVQAARTFVSATAVPNSRPTAATP
jgi:hypothetical protein